MTNTSHRTRLGLLALAIAAMAGCAIAPQPKAEVTQ